MEDSFRVRVDRAFGSLSSSSCLPPSTSLWCLTDEELEKRPWNREPESPADDDDEDPFPLDIDRLLSAKRKLGLDDENRNPNPNSNSNPNPNPNLNADAGDYRRELEKDLQELDDEAGEGTSSGGLSTSSQSREAVDEEEEELHVRSLIGMDCSLDSEQEEDEYDEVAVGRETTGDHLYMSDATDYTPHLYSHNQIPNSCKDAFRDPRANHLGAKLRLKEDAEAAESFNSDEYDKVAVGRETTGDRLYMSGATDYTPRLDSHNEIPNSCNDAFGDPRFNHLGAKLRLKEDAEAAESFNSWHVSERTPAVVSDAQSNKEGAEAARSWNSLHVSEQTISVSGSQNNKEDVEAARFNSLHVSEQTVAVVSGAQSNASGDGKSLKSILKRKEDQMSNLKSEKRVRFEPGCRDNDEKESERDQNVASETSNGENTLCEEGSSQVQDSSLVPDYICNPSRYTHYSFGSLSDMNEESNCQAYMDFLNIIKKSKQSEPDEVPADVSKPVIFNTKKKTASSEAAQSREITMEEPLPKKSLPVSFAF